jgi:adenylate kinase family enzyme
MQKFTTTLIITILSTLILQHVTSIQIQTKILTTITVNLYDAHSTNLVPKTIAVHEGDSMEQVSFNFCNSVGAMNTMQMPCQERIVNALREKFQQRLQNELLFDLSITNEHGVSKSFFYFKNDNVNDAVLSFFYANPEISNDSTSIATLHSAVVAQLTTINYQKTENIDETVAKEDDETTNNNGEEENNNNNNAKEQTLLVITDHCQSFKDVHACRMELMYGPYQVAMANDLDAFNDSMEKMTTENIQEKETTKNMEAENTYGSFIVYGMFCLAIAMNFMKKRKYVTVDYPSEVVVSDAYEVVLQEEEKEKAVVVETVIPAKLNVLSEISINNTFDTLIPTKASKKKVNNNNSNNNNTSFHILHDDQENTVQNTRKTRSKTNKKRKTKKLKTVFKSPLRTTNHAFVHSPMPRI